MADMLNWNADPLDLPPDAADVDRLEAVTAAEDYPAAWLTTDQHCEELDRRGFWTGTETALLSADGRREWLAKVFAGVRMTNCVPLWPRENGDGERFKHTSRLTSREARVLADFAMRRAEELTGAGGDREGTRCVKGAQVDYHTE